MHWRKAIPLVLCASLGACDESARREAEELAGGDAHRGRDKIAYYGCASCHQIPGVYGAQAVVGPSLEGVAARSFLAGELPNNPDNLIRWIQDPRSVKPKTAMPNTGVNDYDARDIASYLYTLR
jgi:cytochrome c